MKVIIQDTKTKAYLSADGRWVANIAEAQDFLTLLRAYHFAKEATSRNFEVLLHCPEDDYSAGIINGVGTGNLEAANVAAAIEVAPIETESSWSSRLVTSKPAASRFTLNFLDTTRNHLN
jgi:hypothetical protein